MANNNGKDPFEIGTSGAKWWKQTEQEKIQGTVVEIGLINDTDFQTKQPKYYKDGNPILKYTVTLKQEDGSEIIWAFKKKGAAMDAVKKALDPQGTRNSFNLRETLGLVLRVSTKNGVYNNNNPRPYWVDVLGKDTVTKVRGAKEAPAKAEPATPAPAPAPQNLQPYQPYAQQAPTSVDAYYDEDVVF